MLQRCDTESVTPKEDDGAGESGRMERGGERARDTCQIDKTI